MARKPVQSYKFFENKKCRFYPCHKGMKVINCLFCYCPWFEHCNKFRHKDCANCKFPHYLENYDKIVGCLKKIEEGKHGR